MQLCVYVIHDQRKLEGAENALWVIGEWNMQDGLHRMWCGAVWYDVSCGSAVWCGPVQCDVVRCGAWKGLVDGLASALVGWLMSVLVGWLRMLAVHVLVRLIRWVGSCCAWKEEIESRGGVQLSEILTRGEPAMCKVQTSEQTAYSSC